MGLFKRLFGNQSAPAPEAPTIGSFSTLEERRAQRVADHLATVEKFSARDAKEDPAKAKRSMVRGKNYIYWVPKIEQLKRDGRLEEALDLTLECCGAAERDRGGREPAPAYTRHAAIICRKLGYLVNERQVLERWLSFGFKSKDEGFENRLAKVEGIISSRISKGASLDDLTRPPKTIRGSLS